MGFFERRIGGEHITREADHGIYWETLVGSGNGPIAGGIALRTGFRYGFDPLCGLCCCAYAINSGVLAPLVGGVFLRGYFNDLLLIPCALPWVLWIHGALGWRSGSAYPSGAEIWGHCLIWGLVAEGLGPLLFAGSVGDVGDLAMYSIGALVAHRWWRRDVFGSIGLRMTTLEASK